MKYFTKVRGFCESDYPTYIISAVLAVGLAVALFFPRQARAESRDRARSLQIRSN